MTDAFPILSKPGVIQMPGLFVVTLPFEVPPLNANQRGGFRKFTATEQRLKASVAALVRGVIPKLERVDVGLVWAVTDRRRRDVDNISPTRKYAQDGLVAGGVLEDDHSGIVRRAWSEIQKGDRKGVALVIEVLEVTA